MEIQNIVRKQQKTRLIYNFSINNPCPYRDTPFIKGEFCAASGLNPF